MNARILLLSVAAILSTTTIIASPVHAQVAPTGTATERTNKDIVARAYAAWASGGTNFFDILDDRVVWTILGPGPHAKRYDSKAAFLEAAVAPFGARLSSPLKPTVRSIHADGHDVVILWDGVATTRDSQTYRNTYAWFFTMRNGRVVEAKALLDLQAYGEVLSRVPAPPKP